ncbi:MAG: hypothetical protein DRN47_00710 [Candidatus Wolframiiraptor sp.]|nr:MAG: hypothetical protein DRN47_00710 [Candidatus Wolframiiraptor sp.]
MASIEDYVNNLKNKIEQRLYSIINFTPNSEILLETVKNGKRLRPILLILVFEAFDGENFESALDLACAIELSHCASLIFDDILDEHAERRGKPALWKKIGIKQSVIIGHKLINLAFRLALKNGIYFADMFLKTWNDAVDGAWQELTKLNSHEYNRRLYMNIVKKKTASMFSAAAEIGALIANARPKDVKTSKRYGEKVGMAFQLADDYIDSILGQELVTLCDYKHFFEKELFSAISECIRTCEKMSVAKPYKDYLKHFPLYCVELIFNAVKSLQR